MRWMIADAELLLDQHGDPSGRPDLATKAVVFGSFGQQQRQVGQLLFAQLRLRARRRLMPQGLSPVGFGFGDPLTDRSFGDPECGGNVFLFPALLIELPGAQASIFAPVVG